MKCRFRSLLVFHFYLDWFYFPIPTFCKPLDSAVQPSESSGLKLPVLPAIRHGSLLKICSLFVNVKCEYNHTSNYKQVPSIPSLSDPFSYAVPGIYFHGDNTLNCQAHSIPSVFNSTWLEALLKSTEPSRSPKA